MRERSPLWPVATCVAAGIPTVQPQDPAQTSRVLQEATLFTVTQRIIGTGTIVIHSGKIFAVGATAEGPGGKLIMPGLVDSHSYLGLASRPQVLAHADTNEMTGRA